MGYSGFAPYGLLRYSGAPSPAADAYRAIKGAYGNVAFDFTAGKYKEAKIFALAIQIGVARMMLVRARNQKTSRAWDKLPSVEKDWVVIPGPNDTIPTRQANVKAQMLLMAGARQAAIETALRALLGDDFITVRVTTPSEIVNTPSDPTERGTFQNVSTTPKYIQILDAIVKFSPSHVTVRIKLMGESQMPMVGEVFSVEPNIHVVSERVTILATTSPAPGDTNDGTITIGCTKAHTAGCYAMTCAPLWLSNQREVRVIVSRAAAADPEVRRKIHSVMQRHEKSVTRWKIMGVTSPTTVGPFVVGVSRVGCDAIGDTAFTF